MRIPLAVYFPATVVASELVGLLALYLAPEVSSRFFLVPAVFGALAFGLRLRLPDRLVLALIGMLVLGAGFLALSGEWIRMGISLSNALTLPLLSVHSLTWLARDQDRYRYWRLGLAFLEVILAAILAPEAHMFFLIFFFVILVSLSLSFGFLTRNFASRNPTGLRQPLRPAFLGAVGALSVVIFVGGLALFPVLPRTENNLPGSFGAMPGFTEEVNFQMSGFFWSGNEAEPAVRVFRPAHLDWDRVVPRGLLRGKTLEMFSRAGWRGGTRREEAASEEFADADMIEILREPMTTEILPVPYGTSALWPGADANATRNSAREWRYDRGRHKRVKYWVKISREENLRHEPTAMDRYFPREGFERLAELGQRLARGAGSSERSRIESVLRYFQNFSPVKLSSPPEAPPAGVHPLEHFVFGTRTGHCELFASAATLLFRSMGVPARMVAGFRVSPPGTSTLLTARNGDAHAWVEVWMGAEGWVPVDPTPALATSTPAWEFARNAYDWVSAYWYRYIVGYEFDGALLLRRGRDALPWIVAAFLVFVLGAGLVRAARFQGAPRTERESVAKVFGRLERRSRAAGLNWEATGRSSNGGESWWKRYERLRFGPELPAPDDVRALERSGLALIREAAASARAAR